MELIVIFLLILVLFGPRRLPEIAKMIGKTIHELRKASEDFKDQLMSIETDPVPNSEPVAEDPYHSDDSTDYDDQHDHDETNDYDEFAEDSVEDVVVDAETAVVNDSESKEDEEKAS